MKETMRAFRLGALWAVAGCSIAVVTWSVLGGVLWSFINPAQSIGRTLLEIPLAIVGSAIWATVIGVIALPVYTVVFTLRLRFATVSLADRSVASQLAEAIALALPPTFLLAHGFASSYLGFDWFEACRVFALALVSCAAGVWLPQRRFAFLRADHSRLLSNER